MRPHSGDDDNVLFSALEGVDSVHFDAAHDFLRPHSQIVADAVEPALDLTDLVPVR